VSTKKYSQNNALSTVIATIKASILISSWKGPYAFGIVEKGNNIRRERTFSLSSKSVFIPAGSSLHSCKQSLAFCRRRTKIYTLFSIFNCLTQLFQLNTLRSLAYIRYATTSILPLWKPFICSVPGTGGVHLSGNWRRACGDYK